MRSDLMPRLRADEQRALQQFGADAVALPRLLDAEGGFRLVREQRAVAPQLGGAAQHAVDEEAVHHDADLVGGGGVAGDELVRHRAGKTPVAAVVVEAQQVVAIGVGLADPQFADGCRRRAKARSCRVS